jgi:serine/threonine protein kinase
MTSMSEFPFDHSGLAYRILSHCILHQGGITGVIRPVEIQSIPGLQAVAKTALTEAETHDREWIQSSKMAIKTEATLLRKLGPYPNIVRLFAANDKSLILEYHSNGILLEYMKSNPPPTMDIRRVQASQAAMGIDHLHRNSIIHCDIDLRKVLISNTLTIIICDLASSSHPEMPGVPLYWARYRSPHSDPTSPRIKDDIFALGTLIYEIITWERLFPHILDDLDSDEIEELFWECHYSLLEGGV